MNKKVRRYAGLFLIASEFQPTLLTIGLAEWILESNDPHKSQHRCSVNVCCNVGQFDRAFKTLQDKPVFLSFVFLTFVDIANPDPGDLGNFILQCEVCLQPRFFSFFLQMLITRIPCMPRCTSTTIAKSRVSIVSHNLNCLFC